VKELTNCQFTTLQTVYYTFINLYKPKVPAFLNKHLNQIVVQPVFRRNANGYTAAANKSICLIVLCIELHAQGKTTQCQNAGTAIKFNLIFMDGPNKDN
jgi:hypothetical protein